MSEGAILSTGRVEASLPVDRGTNKRYLIPSQGTTEQRSLYSAVGAVLSRQTMLADSW